MNVKQLLKNELASSLKKLLPEKDISAENISIEYPENLSHGDFSTNVAMIFFKDVASSNKYKKPFDFATALTIDLNANAGTLKTYVDKIEVAGPGFINFHLKNNYFIEMLNLINTDIDSFAKPLQINKKASLEHTQMNPNKDLHVGHLRNACIGDSLVNLLRYSGRDVIVQYYQNDAGLQISSIVLAFKEKFVDPKNYSKLHKWAAEAYVDIEKRIEYDKVLSEKREQIQMNIANQNNEDAKIAKEVTDEILRNALETMSQLDVRYDVIICESEIIKNKTWEEAFELLKKSSVFYKAETGEKAGCWLVKMPNADDKVFVRANGIPNYVATDFAYELWKFGLIRDFKYENFPLDFYKRSIDITSSNGSPRDLYNKSEEVYLVIDATQSYPQQSIVEALSVLGYKKQAENYHHVAYGFVYLSNKTANKLGLEIGDSTKPIKMSGRRGTVVSIDSFVTQVESALVEKFGNFESLKEVRNGAIKFEMLKNNTYQDMVFDLDAAIDNKGFTGPYVQYTYARAMSLIKKSTIKLNESNINPDGDFDEFELNLLKEINRLPEEIELAIKESSPHYVCHYIYKLAQTYNTFYNSSQIIGSEKEASKILITQVVASTLRLGLTVLGISAPASM